MTRLVVVGNGRAADAFLRHMQHYEHDFCITVFGDGALSRKATWYQDREIELHQGVRILAVDRHARVARGSDGSFTTYDRLILAVGGVSGEATSHTSAGHTSATDTGTSDKSIGDTSKTGLYVPGLQTRRGVVVNGSFETSDGYIYAIGDCAEVRDARWAATLDKQARKLAARLVGESDGVESTAKKSSRKLFLLPKLAATEEERALTA